MAPTVYDQAKIFVKGKRMRIDEGEPLEDSVRTVHSVMWMMAERGGEPTVHNGVRGIKRHMNLTRIVQALTTDHGENDRKVLARLISQVFRQTGAAVCLRHADPHNHTDPVWFVAEKLPENFIVVVGHVRGKSAGTAASRAPTAFDENLFLRSAEKKLPPEEVGEHLPAGEVTVTQTKIRRRSQKAVSDEERQRRREHALRILAPKHEENKRRHEQLVEQVHEYVVTAPVSMTAPELGQLFNEEFGTSWELTTLRSVLKELEAAGRIASRKETREERFIRGGGQPVKATAPMLYGPPEGVPVRDRLPKGIRPLKAALEHVREKQQAHETQDEKVYRAMDVPNSGNAPAPRTVHMIAKAADLSDRETLESLGRLMQAGRVWYNPDHHYYQPMHRVRQTTLEKYAGRAPQPAAADEPPVVHVPTEPGATVTRVTAAAAPRTALTDLPPGRQHAVAIIMDQVIRLAQGNAPAHDEVIRLQQENEQLRERAAQLEDAVAGLRQALIALGAGG